MEFGYHLEIKIKKLNFFLFNNIKIIIMNEIKDLSEIDIITLEDFRKNANAINQSEKGVGNDSDNVSESDLEKWKYYDIVPKFNLKFKDESKEYGFRLLKYFLKENGQPMLIIPGYSDKSGQWTFGRINKFIQNGLFDQKNISSVYIILFVGLKEIITDFIGQDNFYKSDLPYKISKDIDKIIRSPKLQLNNLVLVGRSAGGSHALNIAENNYVSSLHLACPGYNEIVIESFNKSNRKIPISVYWSINDRYINLKDKDKGLEKLKELLNQEINDYVYDYIDNTNNGENHRIPPELIKNL